MAGKPIKPPLLALLLVEFPFLMFAFGALLLYSGWTLSGAVWPLALISTIATAFLLTAKSVCTLAQAAVASLLFLLLVLGATVVSGSIYDVTSDGQTYHQKAVIQLGAGWNPLKTELAGLSSVPDRELEALWWVRRGDVLDPTARKLPH